MQLGKIEIFCEDCKLAAPRGYFRGFEPRFHVHQLHHSVLSCDFFHCLRCVEVFFWLLFYCDCIWQKGECSSSEEWSETFWPGENKLHYCKAHVYKTISFSIVCDCSFLVVFVLDRTWPVWSGCKFFVAGIFCRLQVAGCRLKFNYNWKTTGT